MAPYGTNACATGAPYACYDSRENRPKSAGSADPTMRPRHRTRRCDSAVIPSKVGSVDPPDQKPKKSAGSADPTTRPCHRTRRCDSAVIPSKVGSVAPPSLKASEGAELARGLRSLGEEGPTDQNRRGRRSSKQKMLHGLGESGWVEPGPVRPACSCASFSRAGA
jgi:hypothetical protein